MRAPRVGDSTETLYPGREKPGRTYRYLYTEMDRKWQREKGLRRQLMRAPTFVLAGI